MFLLRPDKPETEQDEAMFDASYKLFCERIIRQRLLVNNEVLRMGQLRQAFIDMVKANEGVDASNYRQDLLKKRLAQDFPQLAFHMPTKRNVCELVFAETLSKDALVDMLPDPSGTETTQSSELSQTDSDNETGRTKCQTTHEDTRTLYTAAFFFKRLLSDTPGMSCPWPPTSENVNVTESQTVVPIGLYNLLSWIIGATEEPTLDHYVNIDDDVHLKVLSVCQDIVYLASKGRKQTPKSLALGLTVRHLTGSSRIVSLLNRLGHCASWDTVLSLDTSLAQLTLVEVSHHS
ncbi:uncharacterized protein LOC117552764 [Gymnodraco acuticeps]|uniref:Uncharacterized protein LOC117552764 n=1 Tax=Gymnodraco acuticeps TaxID=8218 RepID=A0A6P8UWK5_GYMAC|nr:uncharacterized protein LOC117552764 [Gymnodraco acuticeps]